MPPANLRAELRSLGCTILVTDRTAPHVPYDLSAAVALAVAQAHPVVQLAAIPVQTLASALDHGCAPLFRRTRFSNAYRVVARKDGG